MVYGHTRAILLRRWPKIPPNRANAPLLGVAGRCWASVRTQNRHFFGRSPILKAASHAKPETKLLVYGLPTEILLVS